MKHFTFTMILAAFLLLTLAGCGGGPEAPAQDTGMTGLVNPMSGSALAEAEAETGLSLQLPEEDFRDLTVTRINGQPALFSLDFLWSGDGRAYTFRLKADPQSGDISGMYYDWAASDLPEDGAYEVYWNEGAQGICLWQDDTAAFCVIMEEGASRDALVSLQAILAECCSGPAS